MDKYIIFEGNTRTFRVLLYEKEDSEIQYAHEIDMNLAVSGDTLNEALDNLKVKIQDQIEMANAIGFPEAVDKSAPKEIQDRFLVAHKNGNLFIPERIHG